MWGKERGRDRWNKMSKILIIVEVGAYYTILSTFIYVFKFPLKLKNKTKQLFPWGENSTGGCSPPTEVLTSNVWDCIQESAFLTGSQMILAQRLYFGNHYTELQPQTLFPCIIPPHPSCLHLSFIPLLSHMGWALLYMFLSYKHLVFLHSV